MPAPLAPHSLARPPRRITAALTVALFAIPATASAADKAAPAKTDDTSSVGDNIRSLGQQISDPKTLDRIKGHEQDAEKNVEQTRDQQRKNHGSDLRASDATNMATSPALGGAGAPKSAPKPKPSPARVKKADTKGVTPPPKADGSTKPPPAPSPAK